MFKYSVMVKWSDEDNGFIAVVPELEGLSAFGETQEEATKELMIAAEAYIESLEESGQPLPEPEKMISYSGQFRVRLPRSLHAKLAGEAQKEGVSLNTYVVSLLANRQGEREAVGVFVQNALAALTNAIRAPYELEADEDSAGYIVAGGGS